MKKVIYPFLILCLVISCANNPGSEKKVTYQVIGPVKCHSNPSNTYQLALPENHEGSLPLIVILDPHGNGKRAVNTFLPAVSGFNCILAGSYAVHNNMSFYGQAIAELIADVQASYQVSHVFLAGFSGGARMALDYALVKGADGVLMCSAGPDKSQGSLPFPVFMIAGISDFNFGETYYNPLKASHMQQMMSAYFEGIHEWPPVDKIRGGLVFLMSKYLPDGEAISQRESAKLTIGADSLVEKKETFLALKELELAIKLDKSNKKAREMRENIRHDPALSGAIDMLERDLEQEASLSQAYSMATIEKDSTWWFGELEQLKSEISQHSGDRKAHFMRIKAFLGILFYSRINAILSESPGDKNLVHLLAAYRKAEPGNPQVYYDYALYEMKRGNKKAVMPFLKHAVQLGYSDRNRLSQDFPGINPWVSP